MVGDNMKLNLFHGNDTDDPKKYWFLYEAIWILRHVTNDDVKKDQLVTNLWGHAPDWYMQFIQLPIGTPAKTLDEVRKGLIEEFRKLESEEQYIIELKEIKQFPNESVWEFVQRFKTLMAQVSCDMSDAHHK